jgi:hypothetical protein
MMSTQRCCSTLRIFFPLVALLSGSISAATVQPLSQGRALSFEANQGQFDPRVAFLARTPAGNAFITARGVVLALEDAAGDRRRSAAVRLELSGRAKRSSPEGFERISGITNYFYDQPGRKFASRYITNVPSFAQVRQRDVYPGIDLVYYGSEGRIEYDFVVAPGADPRRIRLRLKGYETASLTEAGDVSLRTSAGEVVLKKPLAYQESDGVRTAVAAGFVLAGNQLRFDLAAYDATRPLVIDPILGFSTRLGGSGSEIANAIALDASGNIYVAGTTNSTDFPVASAFQSRLSGQSSVFVTKLNPSGSGIVYSTYLGGRGGDSLGNGIAVDSAGNAYVTGFTSSSSYPVTKAAFQISWVSPSGFVTKLSPMGNALLYSTFVRNAVETNAIAVNAAGNAFITGMANGSFTTTPGVVQPTSSFAVTGYVARLNTTGSGLDYATFNGGWSGVLGNYDGGYGIAVDAAGNAYVAGVARSANFPTTGDSFQPFLRGVQDAFVTKLNPTATSRVYSTYLGGSSGEWGFAVAVDALGQAYVTGRTSSADFPVLRAFKSAKSYTGSFFNNVFEAFVTKLNAAGNALVYSSYLGGPGCVGTGAPTFLCDPPRGSDHARGIAIDAAGSAYVVGGFDSLQVPQVDPVQAVPTPYDGSLVPFVAKIQERASAVLVYATTLGTRSGQFGGVGLIDGPAKGVAVDAAGNAYVALRTYPTPFPVTAGAFQVTGAGPDDAGVFKLSPGRYTTSIQVSNSAPTCAQTITLTATVTSAVPGGQVTFRMGGSSLGTALLTAGTATLNTNLSPGVQELTAVYSGDNKLSRPLFVPVKRVSGC